MMLQRIVKKFFSTIKIYRILLIFLVWMNLSDEDKIVVRRARRIQRFFSQPFHVAEAFTGKAGKYVKLEDTIRGFKGIIDGKYDDLPESAFMYVGTIEEAVENAKQMA